MKALIAAGGRATRLRPITWTTNKHLIPLANKPMLEHAIKKIIEAGITEIAINVNPGEVDLMRNVFGDGSQWGASLTYIEQIGGPKGIAHVVNNAKDFLGDEPFMFYLGDNIILGSLKKFVQHFSEGGYNCFLAFSKVPDPQRFGVPAFDAQGKLTHVVEKPQDPPSNFAVTGIYLYDKMFFEAFANIQPSARGEYEITDVNTWMLQHGKKVGWEEITGWWKDTGTPEAMLAGNASILTDLSQGEFVIEGEVDASAQLEGLVRVSKGAKVGAGCMIRGPVVIGENAELEQAYIGPYTAIGNRCVVKRAEVEHSIVFDGASICDAPRIVDSLIGYNVRIESPQVSKPNSGHKMIVGDNSYLEL